MLKPYFNSIVIFLKINSLTLILYRVKFDYIQECSALHRRKTSSVKEKTPLFRYVFHFKPAALHLTLP